MTDYLDCDSLKYTWGRQNALWKMYFILLLACKNCGLSNSRQPCRVPIELEKQRTIFHAIKSSMTTSQVVWFPCLTMPHNYRCFPNFSLRSWGCDLWQRQVYMFSTAWTKGCLAASRHLLLWGKCKGPLGCVSPLAFFSSDQAEIISKKNKKQIFNASSSTE